MKFLLLIFIFVRVCIAADAPHWLEEQRNIIEQVKNESDENSIEALGSTVQVLGNKKKWLSSEEREIYEEGRKTLSASPQAVSYFKRRIDEITAGKGVVHSSQKGWYFETLAQLPRPETVKILGEYLMDETGKDVSHIGDVAVLADCFKAERALFELGLKNPPVTGTFPRYEKDLHTWQLWYQQVKAGTRTFSFEGDDRVYSLEGEVRNPPSQPIVAQRQEKAVVTGSQTEPETSAITGKKIAIGIALLLAAGGVAAWRSSLRKSHAPR